MDIIFKDYDETYQHSNTANISLCSHKTLEVLHRIQVSLSLIFFVHSVNYRHDEVKIINPGVCIIRGNILKNKKSHTVLVQLKSATLRKTLNQSLVILTSPGPSSSSSFPQAATARQPSGCSRCRPSPGGPSHGMAPPVAPGSSRRTPPGHRRDSGGWRGAARTLVGTRCRSGCPGRGPSRLGEPHPLRFLQRPRDEQHCQG